MSDIDKKINDILERLSQIEKKVDAIIYTDEDAKDFLTGNYEITDEDIHDALDVIMQYEKVSAALLQRRLSIGFGKATKILEHFEKEEVIGPQIGAKPHEVLITDPEEYWKKQNRN